MATSLTTTKLIQQAVEKAQKAKIDVNKKQAQAVVNSFLEAIAEEVRSGGKVNLKNFGVFRRHTKPARPKRMGRNPATGEMIPIAAKPAQNVIKFRPAKTWKEAVAKARARKPKAEKE
jgi:nucleoid DNA-binding protein